MKTISIKQLHAATGRCVREARNELLVVTDHGVKVAVIKPFSDDELPGRPFPKRRAQDLPRVTVDSTALISDDRDGR